MSPTVAAWLADAMLVLHVGVVVFVVVGQALFLVGGWRRWHWVRHRGMRIAHLGLMVFIALQTWLGQLCPLTIWEQQLRRVAGQQTHDRSFIDYWLSELLYVEAPWWAFVAAYTGFVLLVAATWYWVPPRAGRRSRR